MFRCMSDGNVRGRCARSFIQFAGPPVEKNDRRTGLLRGDFDVLPTDATAPSGLQSFERGFFCGKARGIMLRGRGAARFAVCSFGVGENPFSKTRRARDGFANATNFNDVDAD